MDHVKSAVSDVAVLVVDDYREFRRLVADVLRPLGFCRIDDATDGTEALRKLREDDYRLVICDWNMSPMSGYQLLQEVRRDSRLRTIPFVMISGSSQTADHILAAKAAGVTHFLAKPFRSAALLARVKEIVGLAA
jgi:two-component system, chemotaxis family, chemotaxis protein CheY